MFTWIKHYLFTPLPDEQENLRLERLVKTVSIGAIGVTIAGGVLELIVFSASLPMLFIYIAMCLVYFTCYMLASHGRIQLAGLYLTTILWLVVTWVTFFMGGTEILGFSGYIIVLIIASLVFSERAGLLFLGFTIIVIATALVAERMGVVFPSLISAGRGSKWTIQGVVFMITAWLLFLAFNTLREALEKARANERSLERRALQIQTAAEIGRDATVVLKVEKLLDRAVRLICERFGFYYAAIYLLDEAKEYAVLRAAPGQVGQVMLEKGYKLRVGEVGIVGHVAASGEARIVLDVGKDAVHFKNPLLPQTRSEMSLPLKVKRNVIGVLDVQSQKEAAFDAGDIAVLQTMADQLAIAFETARLFEAAQRQLRDLSILQAVATASSQASNEDDLIEKCTQILGNSFYPDNFGLILLDEDTGMLRKHRSYRERIDEPKLPYPLGVGITGRVALEGRARRVPDVSKDADYDNVDPDTRSELCVPLKASDRVIGVINAESTQLDAFSTADERLFATLAGQLATAIQRARFYEQAQAQLEENARLIQSERQRSAELEALRQASLRLTSSLELQPVLETILDQALHLVSAYDAHIFLYDGVRLNFGAARWAGGFQNKPFSEPRPNGLTHTVARSGEKIVVPSVSAHPLFKDHPWEGAILGLPLHLGEEILGVMNLTWNQPRSFNPGELRILELLADQAALALANARLYTQSQERAKDLGLALSKVKELDRLRNEFVQNVSHEMRTPLAVIFGYSELLEKGELGELNHDQQEAMNIIVRRLHAMNNIFGDFLIIMEAETGDQDKMNVDMQSVINEVLDQLKETLDKADLRFEVEINNDIPQVYGVMEHLQRAVDNLIGNAIKFTPRGGLIRLSLNQDEDNIVLEVADTGIGISPEKLERVFERFYQVDGSTTRRYGGTGLGLALVKEVAEAHGGRVTVQSTPGKGSTFRIVLPIDEKTI